MTKQSPNKIIALQEIRTWSADDVSSLLRKNDLSECADLFKTMAINGDAFMDLDESNLIKWRPELGFNKIRMLSRLLTNINDNPEHYVTYYTLKSKTRRNYETVVTPGRKYSDPGATTRSSGVRKPIENSYHSQSNNQVSWRPSSPDHEISTLGSQMIPGISKVLDLRSRMPTTNSEISKLPTRMPPHIPESKSRRRVAPIPPGIPNVRSRFKSPDRENINVPDIAPHSHSCFPTHAPKAGNVRAKSPAPIPGVGNSRPRYIPPSVEVEEIRFGRPPAHDPQVSNFEESNSAELTNESDLDYETNDDDDDGSWDTEFDGDADDIMGDIGSDLDNKDDDHLENFSQDDEATYSNFEDTSQNSNGDVDLSLPPPPPRSNKPNMRPNQLDFTKPSVPSSNAFGDTNNDEKSSSNISHALPPLPPMANPGNFSELYFPKNLQDTEEGYEDYYESTELEHGFKYALRNPNQRQEPILDSPVPKLMSTGFSNLKTIPPKLPPSDTAASDYHSSEQEYDTINEADSRPVLPLPQPTQTPKEGVFKNLLPSFRSHSKPTFSGNKEINSPTDMGGTKKPALPPPSSPSNFSASKPALPPPNVSSPENTISNKLNQRPLPAPPDTATRPSGTYRATPAASNIQLAPWYHHLDRRRAEEALRALGNDGCFMVRPSSLTSNPLTLTLMFKGRFFNIPIRKRSDGPYALGTEKHNEQVYPTVEALIHNYFTEKLALYSCGENSGRTSLTTTPSKRPQNRHAKPS